MKTKYYGIVKPSVHWLDQNPGKSVAELVGEALDNIDALLFAAGMPVPTAQSAASPDAATSASLDTESSAGGEHD